MICEEAIILKRMLVPCLIVFVLLATLITPQQGLAESTLQQATDELKQAEEKQKQAAENLKNAQTKIKKIQAEKKKTTKDIYALEDDIDSLENQITNLDKEMVKLDGEITTLEAQINTLNEQIEGTNGELKSLEDKSDQVEADLLESKRLLQEAIERIELRDSLIRERLRYMYTNGSVPYIEVLFHSTSFKDFLERFQILKMLVDHDQDILEENKSDYEQVALQIVEVEDQLAQLVTLYDQQVTIKDQQTLAKDEQIVAKDQQVEAKDRQIAAKLTQVAAKKKLEALKQTKNNQIAALSKEEEILAVYTEEQEQEMIAAAAIIAASKKSIVYYKGGKLGYPLPETYRISSNFGKRTNPITGKAGAMHSGMDFAAPNGTDILAAETGRVITAGWVNGYGNVVIIDHGDGLWTLYAHGRKGGIQVEVGQTVTKGEKISEVGTTGNSTGYHLHFEVRVDQKAVNPRDYLNL
jgi:murein DD-endopeptidase MepM/ murein hydrolase activator NlpD